MRQIGGTGRPLGILAVAAAFAALLAFAATASAAPLAVVANLNSDAVSLINTATNRQVGDQIEVGDGPASVAITPDGRFAYTANVFGESVSVIDTTTREVVGGPIEVGRGPFGLAISPDGDLSFVTDRGSDEVSAIDAATGEVVAEIPVGQTVPSAPTGVAVTPDGKFAYVTIANENAVEVIDIETMAVVGGPIAVGTGPQGIEFSPDGATAYVVDAGSDEVSAIDTATREVTPIELSGEGPRGIVVAPDGTKAYVVEPASHSVAVIDTETDQEIEAIEVGDEPQEIAVSASGRVLFVTVAGDSPGERTAEVERINLETGARIGSPTELPGEFAAGIAIAPDQSPTAAFTAPRNVIAGAAATFSGIASTDPDGSIVAWEWAFGDGATASGRSAVHTYRAAGSYEAKLSVVDDQGCGEEMVFTGRTAYCSGATPAAHRVAVTAPPATLPVEPIVGPAAPPSNRLTIRRIVHNRGNGTVRLQVRLPSAGSILLFGKRVHAVTRKSKGVQLMWLTIHARVELAKRLKKILRAPVSFRITFTPNGGTARTVHRRVTLWRVPHHKHRTHRRR
jgi:YVTN family beta-propeller protein